MKILFWLLTVLSFLSLSLAGRLYYESTQESVGMVMILFLPLLIFGLFAATAAVILHFTRKQKSSKKDKNS